MATEHHTRGGLAMALVLRVDSSARLEGSKSKELGDYFEKIWLTKTQDRVVRRDLAQSPITHIHHQTITDTRTHSDLRRLP